MLQNLSAMSKEEKLTVFLRSSIACSGVGVTLFSAYVIIRYGQELWRTGDISILSRTEMAPLTAVCFLLLGTAAICGALLWKQRGNE